jgi:hypothetical integral membrane protein (TIGR02206 family)
MKEFFTYFFGQGTEIEFQNFTLAHIAPILGMVAVILLIWRFRERLQNCKHEQTVRLILAFMLIVSEMSYYWRLVGMPSLTPNPVDHLPITVCGWVVIFSSYMLVAKNQTLFDICYFWLFSGTVFALITPTVISYTGPTRFRYYQFWAEHTLGYIAVFYMIFVHGMRPTWRSMAKSGIALAVLASVALAANRMIGPGANYLFLAELPALLSFVPSLFILRFGIMTGVISVMYVLAYLPWYLKDRKMARQMA